MVSAVVAHVALMSHPSTEKVINDCISDVVFPVTPMSAPALEALALPEVCVSHSDAMKIGTESLFAPINPPAFAELPVADISPVE